MRNKHAFLQPPLLRALWGNGRSVIGTSRILSLLMLVAAFLTAPIQADISVGEQLPEKWVAKKSLEPSAATAEVVADTEVVRKLQELYVTYPATESTQLIFVQAFSLASEADLHHYFFEVKDVTDFGVVYVVNADKVIVDKYFWSSFE
jgi:hypothetical protein